MKAVTEDELLTWFELKTTAAVHEWLREERDSAEMVMCGAVEQGDKVKAALSRGKALGLHLALNAVQIELERRAEEAKEADEQADSSITAI